ncbi:MULTISPECIES: FBP domain-containing protein [Microbacterium]|uniref:FBP domain-containing protein n=1 Tax=Microbacterium galbinum TaxID=2851646 RepID=A0ABY4ILC7_9MICO|nr:FBP domain-containing protein [Microbacterium galbinum]MCK2024037.1 FBP domain-containing protein [Microbacterium galbinum]MCK2030746.1 FBP domain-containing protein [Microbacterium galbinum]UPL13560.1 FBP domain-containing protein [Microbacterium galbinum]
MRPIDERAIRASFRNASRKEVSDLNLPAGFADIDFDRIDYLGWVDPKAPRRAYVITEVDGEFTGALLQQAEQRVIARAQCSWCEDVTLRNDVQLFTARKAGPAGRKGDTIGTLVCANFGCSENVRRLPPLAYEGFDRELARDLRIVKLGEHVRAFLAGLDA